ncbi:MAG: hypothetical protein H6Q51_2761 [Deltaproteobacteria bacterium]|nr:hypothetical protein [Deltaproteobacteria bacterium]
MKKLQRALGTLCQRCPLCEKARSEPESTLGRLMAWHGRFCPAWKAQRLLAAECLNSRTVTGDQGSLPRVNGEGSIDRLGIDSGGDWRL